MSLMINIDPSGKNAQAAKWQLRNDLLHRRRVIPTDLQNTTRWKVINNLRTLHSHMAPAVVGIYYPIKGEIDLRSWVQELWNNGETVALPRTVERGHPLIYNIWAPNTKLEPDTLGIPCATGAEIDPALMIIPSVGYNRKGFRLGYGGGFYDRTLNNMEFPSITIGVTYTELEVNDFPTQYHDQRMHYFVTGKEVITC